MPLDVFRHYEVTDTGCWEWTLSRKVEGYGQVRLVRADGWGNTNAHRAAYMIAKGPIPDGLVVDHLCRNRACINPSHLEAVTGHVNVVLRGIGASAQHAAQTHCIHGHEFTPENTYVDPSRRGRHCRECMRESDRRRQAARRGYVPPSRMPGVRPSRAKRAA